MLVRIVKFTFLSNIQTERIKTDASAAHTAET